MSQYSSKLKKCPYPVGSFSGVSIDGKKIVASPLGCNRWDCEFCGPRLKKKLFARFNKGVMGSTDLPAFGRKFLTLTYGGHEKRQHSDPVRAYEELSIALHNTIKALRHIYGDFHYFRVCELHEDGWPHFHIMLVGKTIVPREILGHIEHFWRDVNGMGFVRLNCKEGFRDGKHAANYMLKYVTKNIRSVGKGKRIFTASVGALAKRIKPEWMPGVMVYLGSIDPTAEGTLVYDLEDRILPVCGLSESFVNLGDRVRALDVHQRTVQAEAFRRVTFGSL